MDATLKGEYVVAARFDYVKLRWRYYSPDFAVDIQDQVYAAWTAIGAEHDVSTIKEPKFTVIDPSPNKPDGLYIVELFGLAAEAVHHLPAGWLMQVTYAHVKAFAHGTRLAQLVEMRDLYMSRSARRGATVINGGTAGRSSKGVAMPGIRIGSRKSDWHGVIYARKGFAPGFEGRFADEGVFQRTLAALDFWDNGAEPDRAAWNHFLKSCARETATCFETDAMQRGFQLEDYVTTFGGYARAEGEQMALPIEEADEVVDRPPSLDMNDLYGSRKGLGGLDAHPDADEEVA